jgi:hypothetical protein
LTSNTSADESSGDPLYRGRVPVFGLDTGNKTIMWSVAELDADKIKPQFSPMIISWTIGLSYRVAYLAAAGGPVAATVRFHGARSLGRLFRFLPHSAVVCRRHGDHQAMVRWPQRLRLLGLLCRSLDGGGRCKSPRVVPCTDIRRHAE